MSFDEIKRATEERWRSTSIDPHVYGFQIQPHTKWNSGLSQDEIKRYQSALGVEFPAEFKDLLRVMNGTDKPTLNVFGSSGIAHREGIGVYSYPRDLDVVKTLMSDYEREWNELNLALAEQGFELPRGTKLVPFYQHRCIVCSGNVTREVLSVGSAADAIVYANSLREYLEKEFLSPSLVREC